jgi:hypothetical protein
MFAHLEIRRNAPLTTGDGGLLSERGAQIVTDMLYQV